MKRKGCCGSGRGSLWNWSGVNNTVKLAIVLLIVAVILSVYFSRDMFVENLVENLEGDEKKHGPQGKRGHMGPKGLKGDRGPRGESGGMHKEHGRISNIGCLEGTGKGGSDDKTCHLVVNRLGTSAGLHKRGHDMNQIWKHHTDDTIRNVMNNKCLNFVKNNGVGAPNIKQAHCPDGQGGTKWIMNSASQLMPVSGGGSSGNWALTADGDKAIMSKSDPSNINQRWTWHE